MKTSNISSSNFTDSPSSGKSPGRELCTRKYSIERQTSRLPTNVSRVDLTNEGPRMSEELF